MPFSFLKRKKKEEKKSEYIDLTVKEVVKETEDAVSIVFNQPSDQAIDYLPGQFLTLIQNINDQKVRRAYSLSSSTAINELPTVTIKRVEGGLMSNHINNNISAGDTIEVMKPMGTFTIDINKGNKQHVFLFGGGSGITPLISIAKTILNTESESKVSLIYANRDENSIIFRSNLESLQNEFGERFDIVQYLETAPADWSGETGYMTADKLKSNITALQDTQYSEVQYMTCGPEPLMNIVMDTLDAIGIPADKKHKESFVAGTTSPDSTANEGESAREVTVILDGEEHKYSVAPNKTILEAGLDLGIDLPYSCQSGLCTACRGNCKSGNVKMDDVSVLTPEEQKDGYVLMCVSKPKSDDVVIEVG